MKEFTFMFRGNLYKYADGTIYKLCHIDFYTQFCPVISDLAEKLEDLPLDLCKSIMQAILSAYYCGIEEGRKEKMNELRRVLDIK